MARSMDSRYDPATISCAARPGRRQRQSGGSRSSSSCSPMKGSRSRSLLSTSAVLFLLGVLPNIRGASGQFEYGDPIDVTVTAGDTLTISFSAEPASALAVSFEQCSGNRHLEVVTMFNGTSITEDDSIDGKCTRVRGRSALLDDPAVDHDNLCAFQNSGTVANGYRTEDSQVDGTNVDPDFITTEIYNSGTITATAQVVMFSTTYPAPNKDEKIDRVIGTPVQDGNTYTVEAVFQAEGAENENFCTGADGCNVAAYYIPIDDNENLIFGTACQARTGVLMYEGYTGPGTTENGDLVTTTATDTDELVEADGTGEENDDAAANEGEETATAVTTGGGGRARALRGGGRRLDTTAFELSACVEFPKNTAGTYRLYVVVSPDTASSSRVGFGMQDQLMYESGEITVAADADVECPEPVVDVENSGSRSAGLPAGFVGSLAPVRASAAMASALAAAAAASRVAAAEL